MATEHLVLLIEDDPAYASLVAGAIEKMELDVQLQVLSDGEIALDYLNQRGEYATAGSQRPELVLLDLRLPKVDGLEVLAAMKEVKILRRIPVVAMNTSDSEEDVGNAYDLGVNGYLAKPAQRKDIERMIQGLLHYWLTCNRTAQVA